MTRIKLGDEALDRAPLAGGVPALEEDADRGAYLLLADLTSQRQPELRQPGPGGLEALRLLLLRKVLGKIHLVEPAHLRTSGTGPEPLAARKPATAMTISVIPAITAMAERDA